MAERRLIEAVKGYRLLYDPSDDNYMKTKMKNRVWEELAKELDYKNGDEAKTIWLKLRGSYRDAKRRQMKCIIRGTPPQDIKPWRFQNQMSFLDECSSTATGPIEVKISYGSDDESQNFLSAANETTLESDGLDWSPCNLDERNEERYIEDFRDDNESSSASRSSLSHTFCQNKSMQDNKDCLRHLRKFEDDGAQEVTGKKRVLKPFSSDDSDDPLYNFFLSMYQLTKAMPSNYQHKIRGQVFQAVSQAEEEIMNIQTAP